MLGGSYCIGNYVAKKLGMQISELTCELLTSPEVKERLGKITFITATDGNHGWGIAWTANRLGQGCVVLMPKGSAAERLKNIRALGADAWITDVNYDDTVRLARKLAEENGWVLVQDTAWDGYEEIPSWIMQGYTTMGCEIVEQLAQEERTELTTEQSAASGQPSPVHPTHIFLQAGVGAMAGLCCGEACTIAWEVLESRADCYISMPDWVAARGMRMLGCPVGEDARIISGESGASAFGLAAALLLEPELEELKHLLGIDENSRILCISTEGATDLEGYRRIVWDGWYPNQW